MTSVSKLGKKEISIYSVSKHNREDASSSALEDVEDVDCKLLNSYGLEAQDEVVGFQWIVQENNKAETGKKKRRRSVDVETNGDGVKNFNCYLTVVLRNGHIMVYSPFQKHIVNDIDTKLDITTITSSIKNSFWVATAESNKLYEYEIGKNKPKSVMKLKNASGAVALIKEIAIDNENYLIVVDDNLTVYNKTSGAILLSIEEELEDITSVEYKDDVLYIAQSGSIVKFSVSKKSKIQEVKASKTINKLELNGDLVSLNSAGEVQIFNKKKSVIKSNNEKIKFNDFITIKDRILISWIDFEPKIVSLASSSIKKAKVEIDVKYVDTKTMSNGNKKSEFVNETEIDKSKYKVKETELPGLVQEFIEEGDHEQEDEDVELFNLLISNGEYGKIKLTTVSVNKPTAQKLISKLLKKIETNPSESLELNNWLKWLLLAHGNEIDDKKSLKLAKQSIKAQLSQLPTLLGLQGRLELLKAQLELRNNLKLDSVIEPEVDNELNLIRKAEENIVYVNGENDDVDGDGGDVIGSAGNSESDEPEQEEEEEEDDDLEMIEQDEEDD